MNNPIQHPSHPSQQYSKSYSNVQNHGDIVNINSLTTVTSLCKAYDHRFNNRISIIIKSYLIDNGPRPIAPLLFFTSPYVTWPKPIVCIVLMERAYRKKTCPTYIVHWADALPNSKMRLNEKCIY